ncbi:beta-1,3-galactosyltransferase 1-like [Gastrophryne carolinensis]
MVTREVKIIFEDKEFSSPGDVPGSGGVSIMGRGFAEQIGPAMVKRLRICQLAKIFVLSIVLMCFSAVYIDLDEAWDNLCWLYHSLTLFSFSHTIIVLNSSSSTIHHPLAPPYPYPYRFVINPPGKCQNRNPFLVLLVTVESHDLITRNIIRETWGDEKNYGKVDVMRIFLIGHSVLTGPVQRLLENESTIYGDIVQQDFLDTYSNLTLKILMGMEWVVKFCPNANYVMKVDSDVFLNVDYLVFKLLRPELPARQNFLTGLLWSSSRPRRDKSSKWYLPEELYPGNTFPRYPSGPGYVFSSDMARKIYEVAQEIVVLNIEDVFIGLCLYKLNISPTRPPRNVFYDQWVNYDPLKFCNLVMVHHYERDSLQKVWKDFWPKKTLLC